MKRLFSAFPAYAGTQILKMDSGCPAGEAEKSSRTLSPVAYVSEYRGSEETARWQSGLRLDLVKTRSRRLSRLSACRTPRDDEILLLGRYVVLPWPTSVRIAAAIRSPCG
jgi:hypothetical protein